jgi:hypothetical protein
MWLILHVNFSTCSIRVPQDSAPKEGGFDTRHNWRSSLHLISMAEGLTYASRGELFVHAVSWPAHIAEISRRLEEIDLCMHKISVLVCVRSL